jgi:hypothetical protein
MFRRSFAWLVAVSIAVFGLVAGGATSASATTPGVVPATVTATLAEGTSTTVDKTVTTPVIPPQPDIYFLSDTTGSMGPAIANVQSNASTILSDIAGSTTNPMFGAGDYRDFLTGESADYGFKNDAAIGSAANAQTGINTWGTFVGSGGDGPEAQLFALHQIATDSSIGFRSTSTRIVVWFGDAPGHDPICSAVNGTGSDVTESSVESELAAAHIEVIAISLNTGGYAAGLNNDNGFANDNYGGACGSLVTENNQAKNIAAATGGEDLFAASPGDVSNVILAGLHNLPVTVTPQASPCDPDLTVSWSPTSETVTSGTDATFTETIAVSSSATPGSTLTCTVEFLLNGQDAGSDFTETITVNVPKHDASLAVNNGTSDFNDPGTVSGTLTDANTLAPIAGATVMFTMNATETCSGTTAADGTVSCQITPSEPAGTYPLTASFGGDGQHNSTTGSADYVVTLEETTTTYTGPTLIANGQPATLSGVLMEDGTTPISGRTLTLTIGTGGGAQSCTGTTDGTGSASCPIASVNQPLGPGTVSAAFAGDAFYLPSSASANTIVFAFLANGSFVIGDKNATVNNNVTFWGSQWWKLNTPSGGTAPSAFKGFANVVSTNPPACADTWHTTPGNSPPPPAGPLPSYMAVIASAHVTQSGSTISGDVPEIVIVHTANGYAPNPGHAGTGTVVAVLCHA